MRYIPAFLYHLLPLVPLAFGYYYITGGAVLLVALAYIKVHKLRAQEIELAKRPGRADPTLRKAMRFWEGLTFLKPLPVSSGESAD